MLPCPPHHLTHTYFIDWSSLLPCFFFFFTPSPFYLHPLLSFSLPEAIFPLQWIEIFSSLLISSLFSKLSTKNVEMMCGVIVCLLWWCPVMWQVLFVTGEIHLLSVSALSVYVTGQDNVNYFFWDFSSPLPPLLSFSFHIFLFHW